MEEKNILQVSLYLSIERYVTTGFKLSIWLTHNYQKKKKNKVMTNLDSILKSRDITLSTKVHLVKAMVFPLVIYGCENWTINLSSSVLGISQARILERVVVSFSRGFSWPRDWTHVSGIAGRFFTNEQPGKPREIINTWSSSVCQIYGHGVTLISLQVFWWHKVLV